MLDWPGGDCQCSVAPFKLSNLVRIPRRAAAFCPGVHTVLVMMLITDEHDHSRFSDVKTTALKRLFWKPRFARLDGSCWLPEDWSQTGDWSHPCMCTRYRSLECWTNQHGKHLWVFLQRLTSLYDTGAFTAPLGLQYSRTAASQYNNHIWSEEDS